MHSNLRGESFKYIFNALLSNLLELKLPAGFDKEAAKHIPTKFFRLRRLDLSELQIEGGDYQPIFNALPNTLKELDLRLTIFADDDHDIESEQRVRSMLPKDLRENCKIRLLTSYFE